MLEKIVIALAAAREWEKAQEIAERIEGSYEKTEAFCEIAAQSLLMEQAEQALNFLEAAEKAANQIEEPWQKAELLNRIAQSLFRANIRDKAEKVWEQAISAAQHGEENADVQRIVDSSSVLWEIAETLDRVGRTEKALEVARAIKSIGKREKQ